MDDALDYGCRRTLYCPGRLNVVSVRKKVSSVAATTLSTFSVRSIQDGICDFRDEEQRNSTVSLLLKMEELPGPINRILARLEGDEAEGTLSYVSFERPEKRRRVPVFVVRPGAQLWLLNDAGSESLWEFIESHPGMIIRFSETCHVGFLFAIHSAARMDIWLADGIEYVAVGPMPRLCRYTTGICVLHRFFSPATSLPFDNTDLALFKRAMEDALRFQAGILLQPGTERTGKKLVIEGVVQDDRGPQAEEWYSVDCWRACFHPDLWNNHDWTSVGIQSLSLSDEHWTILGRLSIDRFDLIQMTVQWAFLENTHASKVRLDRSQLERPREPTLPLKTAIEVSFEYGYYSLLDSPEQVDGLLAKWLSTSWSIVFQGLHFTEATWKYLWTSPVLLNDRICTHLAFTYCFIEGRDPLPKDFSVIPMTSWVMQEFTPCLRGDLYVCRVLPALSSEEMTFFRPLTNPLLVETPPFDVRQSVLLEALLRHRNDPARLQQLLLAYSRTLLQPRVLPAIVTDLETSVVELRALAIDQQAMIDLLLEVNHSQHSANMNLRLTVDRLDERVKDLESRVLPP